jgi:hypothetical protein
MMEGPRCRFRREKHEPASDIDTALMDSLKVLDPERPIREADITSINLTKFDELCCRACNAPWRDVALQAFVSKDF